MTRNEQIYIDKMTMTYKAVGERYGLSKRTIVRICREESMREAFKQLRLEARQWRGKYFNELIKKGNPPL